MSAKYISLSNQSLSVGCTLSKNSVPRKKGGTLAYNSITQVFFLEIHIKLVQQQKCFMHNFLFHHTEY